MTKLQRRTAFDLAYNPEPKPESSAEQWAVFNKMWEDQIIGSGLKVYEEHCMAKLRACIVGDPFAMYIPNPNDVELKQMIEDNASDELKAYWEENKNQHMRDADPERYRKICEEITARDRIYEENGVTVIRNLLGWYPDELVDYNASWGGSRFLSIYASCAWRNLGKSLIHSQTTGPCRAHPAATRAAMGSLMLEDQEATILAIPDIEPNPSTTGPGYLAIDAADWRIMPNKTVLWEYGAPSIESIDEITTTGKGASAGWPRGRDIFARLWEQLGYKSETMWFDSKHVYHGDCNMMNIKEGVVGLPDDGKGGAWGELPKCLEGYEIIPLPVEDIKRGVSNATCLGDGRVFLKDDCVKTIEILKERGYQPIPIPYTTTWDTFNSGLDCSDANIWREND